jgi:hypothetical protein
MDFEEIKKLIETEQGKIIFVENGKPILVAASFEDYKKRPGEKRNNSGKKETKPFPKELADEELKIEDLPF